MSIAQKHDDYSDRTLYRWECLVHKKQGVWVSDRDLACRGVRAHLRREHAGPPASTDAVSPDERARGTSQAAETTAEAARALGLTPRPIP